jgi:hypothetical protein
MCWSLQKPLERSNWKSGQNISEWHKKWGTLTVRHYAVWEGLLHDNCAFCPVSQDMGKFWSVHLGKVVGTMSVVEAPHIVESVTLMEWSWQFYSFFNLGTRWRWVVNVMPRPLYPPGKTRYLLYRRLGGPQGRSGLVRKFWPPPGFDPRTVQPVVSRYTDWAILAHNRFQVYRIIKVTLELTTKALKGVLDGGGW